MKRKLTISEVIEKKSAILHSDGLKLYGFISDGYKESDKIEISFKGLMYCTSAFLNASIGKFLMDASKPDVVIKHLKYSDITDTTINDKIKQIYEFVTDEKKRAIHKKNLRKDKIYA